MLKCEGISAMAVVPAAVGSMLKLNLPFLQMIEFMVVQARKGASNNNLRLYW